jgi:hypothetical protein
LSDTRAITAVPILIKGSTIDISELLIEAAVDRIAIDVYRPINVDRVAASDGSVTTTDVTATNIVAATVPAPNIVTDVPAPNIVADVPTPNIVADVSAPSIRAIAHCRPLICSGSAAGPRLLARKFQEVLQVAFRRTTAGT